MKKTFACLSMVFSMALCAFADRLPAKALDEALANPVKIAAIMGGLKPEERVAAARDLLRHAAAQELPAARKKQALAKLAAACIAAVPPEERASMATALVNAVGKEHVSIVVAAIALSAGADEAGKKIVNAAVAAAEVAGVKAEATAAAQSPDAVLGAELSAEVVQVTQAAAAVSTPTVSVSPGGEPEGQQPIAPPPTPPRAHPYEAQ